MPIPSARNRPIGIAAQCLSGNYSIYHIVKLLQQISQNKGIVKLAIPLSSFPWIQSCSIKATASFILKPSAPNYPFSLYRAYISNASQTNCFVLIYYDSG